MLLRLPVMRETADRRTLNALAARRLVAFRGSIPNRYMPAWPHPAVSPSELGLAVRAELERQEQPK